MDSVGSSVRASAVCSHLHRAVLHSHELPPVSWDVIVAPDLEGDFYGALAVEPEEGRKTNCGGGERDRDREAGNRVTRAERDGDREREDGRRDTGGRGWRTQSEKRGESRRGRLASSQNARSIKRPAV